MFASSRREMRPKRQYASPPYSHLVTKEEGAAVMTTPSLSAFRAQRSGVEKSRHEISPFRDLKVAPVEMTTTQPNGRIGRDDKGTTQRSLQSKALRYSLKPVNDSMRPPHVLLLSDSNPYSPKVNSMM